MPSSDDVPTTNLPATAPTLSRAALERVLARAAELQASATDPLDDLSETQLLELGKEVGLSAQHLKQALAEERTRVAVPDQEGAAARLLGSAVASASRTVRGAPAELLIALDRWMQKDECLQVKRRFPDRMLWEPRRDLVGSIKRGFNIGGRGYSLTRAQEVAATVIAMDDARSIVRLDADLSNVRTARLQVGTLAVAGGALSAGTFAALGFFVPVALVPVAVSLGAGYVIARSHRDAVGRAQLALEQVLDRLEHGDLLRRTPSAVELLAEATRMLK